MAAVAPSPPPAADHNLSNESSNPNPSDLSTPNTNPPAVASALPPPPVVPSFRPLGAPRPPAAMPVPQYSAPPVPGAGGYAMPPGVRPPLMVYPPPQQQPGVPMPQQPGVPMPQQYAPMPNGYMPVPPQPAHGAIVPPGMPRYPAPYPGVIRTVFPGRPMTPVVGIIPQVPRPPIIGVRPVPPIVNPAVRPVVPVIPPAEKPQTTVYVGKIASTVDNDFLLSLLRLCGPVKSWKRAQDPSDGTPKAFGFCEFEAAEGILRALRLLSKLNVDGQELVLNINKATREYLERYVENKREKERTKSAESDDGNKEGEISIAENISAKSLPEQKDESEDQSDEKSQDESKIFGIVTNEDREEDKAAQEKIVSMMEERLKTRPPPPPPSADPAKSQLDINKAKDGDSDLDAVRSDSAQGRNDEDNATENKSAAENDKSEIISPERRRRERSKERERERDRREKDKEYEKVNRERERDRARRERDRENKNRESERLYKDRLKDWEAREREKEHLRQYEKEREKERERERRREILRQENDDDDDYRKRRHRSSLLEEKKRKRLRELEEDMADRLKEKEEIAEAKRRALEEQQRQEEMKARMQVDPESSMQVDMEEDNKPVVTRQSGEEKQANLHNVSLSANGADTVSGISIKSEPDEMSGSALSIDCKQNSAAVPSLKLGFGLIGSGKRASVPSVFGEEDDEDVDEKKMRPLVPIDYSTEEIKAVQGNAPNDATSESAKRNSKSREDRPEVAKERSRRSRNDDEAARSRVDTKERTHDREKEGHEKPKPEFKKILDAKQLIDMIPKTKDELFSYNINWAIYDKHELHERLRPWISKKITDFLGEEEATLVDYIVSCTKDHVQASRMLELLESILDDEAEMFVLKMWRMLIYEIKRVESGLSGKLRA